MVPSGLFGLGGGLTVPSMVGAVLAGIKPAQAGAASGVLTTAQQFAGAAGVAVVGTVFFAVLGSHPGRSAFTSAAEVAGLMDLALIGLSAVLVRLLPLPAAAAPAAAPAREPVLDRKL